MIGIGLIANFIWFILTYQIPAHVDFQHLFRLYVICYHRWRLLKKIRNAISKMKNFLYIKDKNTFRVRSMGKIRYIVTTEHLALWISWLRGVCLFVFSQHSWSHGKKPTYSGMFFFTTFDILAMGDPGHSQRNIQYIPLTQQCFPEAREQIKWRLMHCRGPCYLVITSGSTVEVWSLG